MQPLDSTRFIHAPSTMAEQVVVDPNTALDLVTGFAGYVEIIIHVPCSKIGETLPVKDATTHKGVECTYSVCGPGLMPCSMYSYMCGL